MNILITGGSGLVGNRLSQFLQKRGHTARILSTNRARCKEANFFFWNPSKKELNQACLHDLDCIVHLAGAGIAEKRWTKQRMNLIADSRIDSAHFLFDVVKEKNIKLKSFVSASGVGYYGAVSGEHIYEESDLAAEDFLGRTCFDWEKAGKQFESLGARTVFLRTGIVLSKKKGALAKMTLPMHFGMGSAMGNGNQYLPWIHIDDLCSMYCMAIEDTGLKGPYNAVAPEHCTSIQFSKTLSKTIKKFILVERVPALLIQLALGKMSAILLEGSRVSSQKIKETGFIFRYPNLKLALENLFPSKE